MANFCGKPMRHIIYDRTKADVEISALDKISAPIKKVGGKVLRLSKSEADVLRLLTIWAWQNLQLLTSSKSG